MSAIIYNQISLPYPLTTQFNQTAKYDEVGHTDFYIMEYDIKIQAILNIAYISVIAPQYAAANAPDNAGAIMKAIRKDLLTPRKNLSYKINDVELIPKIPDTVGIIDAMNGPQPKSCTLQQITEVTFLLTWHIVAHYWENPTIDSDTLAATYKNGAVVLYNRWSEVADIDNCEMTTRTREGKYMIRSDNHLGNLADNVRSDMAVLSVPYGFMRKARQYNQSADGLTISYRIVDQEIFKMPPKPAFEAVGYYTESGVGKNTPKRYGFVYLKLKGAKGSDQVQMVINAFQIANNKLVFNGRTIPMDYSITVGMYENVVELRMYGFLGAKKERLRGVPFLDSFTVPMCFTEYPPGYGGPDEPPAYTDRGTASLLLQAAKYYDPNIDGTKLVQDVIVSTNKPTPAGVFDGDKKVNFDKGLNIGEGGIKQE